MQESLTMPTITAESAEKLATTIEVLSQDLRCPVEVCPRFDVRTGELTRFTICPLTPDATVPPGSTTEATAEAIAGQLDVWSSRFASVAGAIRERFSGDVWHSARIENESPPAGLARGDSNHGLPRSN